MARTTPSKSALEHMAPHATHRTAGSIRVRATRRGFYDNEMKEPGAVFTITSKNELGSWMEFVSDDANEAHVATKSVEAPEKQPGTKSANDVL